MPILVAVAALAGCTAKSNEPASIPTALTTLGQGSPTPSPAASPVVTKTSTPPIAPAYPQNAKAYAEAVIAAWKNHKIDRLGDLTTPEVQEQLLEIPGPPNMDWTYIMCDGAAGSSYCQFQNADGDKLTLKVVNQYLGKAHAVGQVTFES